MHSVKGDIYEIIDNKIGNGSYGEIYKINRVKDNKTFVLKKYVSIIDEIEVGALREISILNMLKKSGYCCKYGIIELEDIIITNNIIGIILPYYRISLEDAISKKQLDSRDKLNIFRKLLRSISFLHDNNIIHRDIKPDNIMLDQELNPILIDFTLSKMFNSNDTTETHTGGVSTEFYRAPEVKDRKPYGLSSDSWSLGIVFYEMYGMILSRFKGLLNKDPNKRITPKAILSNIFKEEFNVNIYKNFTSNYVCETIKTICENIEIEKDITCIAANMYYNISDCDPYIAILLASKFYETVPMSIDYFAVDKDEFMKNEFNILNKMDYNLNIIVK